ncbi:MAG TPA: aldolase/citrate lyase family protein [Nocardioidaceae bacterium]
MAVSNDGRYLGVRSVIETPIMDDRKWAKIPDIRADGFLVDMEDSVPPGLKEAARERVVEYVQRPEYFGGRLVVARVNHLSTPWGRDDIAALAEAGVTCVAYPKLETPEDVVEVQELFRAGGADPDLFAPIESARAVLEVARIASIDKVVSVGIGVGDLSVDMGVPLYGSDGQLNALFLGPKVQVALAGAAFGRLIGDMAFPADLRDLDEVRRQSEASRHLGYNMGYTFYPPHVPVINDVFTPSKADADAADEVIGLYEAAVAAGDPAVTLPSGRTILVHDYRKALRMRAKLAAIRTREVDDPGART